MNETDHRVQRDITNPRLRASVRVVRGSPTFGFVAGQIEFNPLLTTEDRAGQLFGAYRFAVEIELFRQRPETCPQLIIQRLLFIRGLFVAC